MRNYIYNILEIHCKIYKKDFLEYKIFFDNKENKDSFILEFINIYDNLDIYENIFDKMKNNCKENFKNIKKREDFFKDIKIFEKDFWVDFLCFSILNNIIKESYFESKEKEDNSVNLISVINLISNDFFNFLNFLYVNNVININENDLEEKIIKKFVFRLVIELKKKKIFEIKKITVYNEEKNEIRHSNFIYIENIPKPKNLFLIFKISNEKSTIKKRNNIILIGFYHYLLNTKLIQKKSFKKESIIYEDFIKSAQNRASTKFFMDWKMIENIKEKKKEIMKESLKKNIKDLKKYIIMKKLIQEEKINLDNDFEEIKKIKSKISKIQKELSLNIDFWIFENLIEFLKKFEKGFYFIPFYDFRGRAYTDSRVSPQSNWIFRFIYNFGELCENENIEEKEEILNLDEEVLEKMKKLKIEKDFEVLSWVFLSIGFQFKSTIRDDRITQKEFIIKGIEIFDKYRNNIKDFYDILEIKNAIECIYYFEIINSHINKKIIKRYIIKDTTASVYQHLGKILIFKNEEALDITNLGKQDIWRDTYKPIMENFESIIEKDIEMYFKRKYVKKLLFTTKYNIGSKKAFKNFLEGIGFIEDKEIFKKIASTFQKIYLNLVKGIVEEKLLYENTLKDLNIRLQKEEYFQLEDISVNLTYHKSIKKEINIFDEGERFTLSNYETSKEIDYEKMKIANVPNIVHSLDALYARRICNTFFSINEEIYSNHDAFYISYYNTKKLIIVAKKCIKIEENFNFLKGKNKELKKISSFILS